MIYRLRKKFIGIVTVSFISVFLILLLFISIFTMIQTNSSLDTLADIVSANDGKFPAFEEFGSGGNQPSRPPDINQESQFTTRFFTVRFDLSGQLLSADIRAVASVTKDDAISYAKEVLKGDKDRGWKEDFRYKKVFTQTGINVIFINGTIVRNTNQRFLMTSTAVFFGGSFVVLLLIIFLSKWAVKPTAESYEKQKQFITDANHELKTPLTIIRTNLDIMESESGANEWLSDIRDETDTMTELVNQLVTLARMDEEENQINTSSFYLSDVVLETVSVFETIIINQQKNLTINIAPSLYYNGDEATIRQLVSILMDNAVKYCDDRGIIRVALQNSRHPTLTVDNTYSEVGNTELSRLFDRFYRADKARTSGSGFGVGLSIAKAIVEKHHGSISVQNVGGNIIRFQVQL